MRTFQIAVDGPAGSGKSTVAKKIAKALGIVYLDTGAMYRALTYLTLKMGLNPQSEEDMETLLSTMVLEMAPESVTINNEDVTTKIRTPEISRNVSAVAMHLCVRESMKHLQRQIASEQSVIMDGRDIGTNVLPDAPYKFFLVATVEERAKRRFKELEESGYKTDLESLKKEILTRDQLDSEREHAPLLRASDAKLIDTTGLTIDEVVNVVLNDVIKGEAL